MFIDCDASHFDRDLRIPQGSRRRSYLLRNCRLLRKEFIQFKNSETGPVRSIDRGHVCEFLARQVGITALITSSQNAKIKQVRALLGRAKERREANAFVIEGVRLVEEAETRNWNFRFALYAGSMNERGKAIVQRLIARGIDVEEVSENLMKSLSDTETPQGILAVLEISSQPVPNLLDFVLIPDQIRDPGNLGTLLRSAAATGVQAVFLPPEATDPFAPKVLRSGMGAHFRLPMLSMSWEEIEARTKDLQIYVADMDGKSCWETDLRQRLALIVGGEAEGASEEARKLATGNISIPMAGNVESLNAGVAGSVLMFEVVRQRKSNGQGTQHG